MRQLDARDGGASRPLWSEDTIAAVRGDELPADSAGEVVVVGGGIAGLSVAYVLAKAGRSVVVLEAGRVGHGETGRTTAHLASALDDRFSELEKLFGEDGARDAAQSHDQAIDFIEHTCLDEGIDCDFRRLDGVLWLAEGAHRPMLEAEAAAARRAGFTDLRLEETVPGMPPLPGPCLIFPEQAQFHPLRYLHGLARAIERRGGRIHEGAFVREVRGGERAQVVTADGKRVRAEAIVIATDSPINNRLTLHSKQAAYRTYVVSFAVPRGAVPTALYWDTADPYHYVRLADGGPGDGPDVLIVGGEDHRTGQDEDPRARWTRLEAWTRTHFPMAGAVRQRWSGQILEPVDALAFIGRNPHDEPNVFVATGDSGHGMTHGTIAGMLIGDLVMGRDNPWARLYDPRRLRPRALGTFARENANTAAQYADWVGGGEVRGVDEIARGEGAVLRRGLRRVAVYKDDEGTCHERSAACPHLGGVVTWNAAEKTWDCPAHGSRFDCKGHVVNGPANGDLAPLDEGDGADLTRPAPVVTAPETHEDEQAIAPVVPPVTT